MSKQGDEIRRSLSKAFPGATVTAFKDALGLPLGSATRAHAEQQLAAAIADPDGATAGYLRWKATGEPDSPLAKRLWECGLLPPDAKGWKLLQTDFIENHQADQFATWEEYDMALRVQDHGEEQ
jgi:hypothetical protein